MAEADLGTAMTSAHKQMLLSRYSEFGHKICTLSELLPGVLSGDVTDPFGQSQAVYDDTSDILEKPWDSGRIGRPLPCCPVK